ncbi:unannotated protein [freshwater metagenome]|uniref:Unannotated protein n=1 Tax=freshwater metagenome TaxID=449393 RepID=A0A6J7SKE1_9ZZZZ
MDHASFNVTVSSHTHTVAQHRVLAEFGPRFQETVVANHSRAVNHHTMVDLDPFSNEHPGRDFESRNSNRDFGVQDVFMRPQVGTQGSNVLPVAFGH